MKKIIFIILSLISLNVFSQSCPGISGTGIAKSKGTTVCYDTVKVTSYLNTVIADTFSCTKATIGGVTITNPPGGTTTFLRGDGAFAVPSGATSGTVTTVSVATANGVSGSVANPTTTPAITLTLGAITPSTVNGVTLSGSSTPTLAVTGTTTISGTHSGASSGANTGDQTTVTGNAGTATALQTPRAINGTNFDGTAPITVTAVPSGSAGGDLSVTYPNPTVSKLNGTSLAGLGTGILKNTTGTGVPSIATQTGTGNVVFSAGATMTGTTIMDSLNCLRLNVGTTDTIRYLYRVVVFGTSITTGAFAGVTNNDGFTYGYSNLYANISGSALYMKGLSGTTLVANSSNDNSMENRVSEIPTFVSPYRYLIFEYGVNDANNVGRTYDSVAFKASYSKIIDTATIKRGWPATNIILLITYTNTVASKLVYKTVKTVSITKGCKYAAAYEAMLAAGPSNVIKSDSIHPNKLGHSLVANSILTITSQGYKRHAVINSGLAITGNLQVGGVIEGGIGYANSELQIAPKIRHLQQAYFNDQINISGRGTFDSSVTIGQQANVTSRLKPESLILGSYFQNTVGANIKIQLVGGLSSTYGIGVSSSSQDYHSGGAHTFYGASITKYMTLNSTGNVIIGTTSLSSVTTPRYFDCGQEISSTAGTNLKIKLYQNLYGFTVSSGELDYQASGADHAFFNGTTRLMIIKQGGNIGIGTTTNPTARFHLPAGAAAAAAAPLKLTSGTNLTTTEAGAIEYDGTHLYYSAANSGPRYTLDRQVIGGSVSTTGTATTTFTVTIGATQANSTYKVTATPSNVLSAAVFYINNKTTTTFDVVYLAGLTGAVAFDWILAP